MEFKDRVANKPNRVKIIYEDSGASSYATVELADEPIEEGTPLNKATFDGLQNEFNEQIDDLSNDVDDLKQKLGKMTLVYTCAGKEENVLYEGDEIEPLTTQVFPLYYITIWSGSSVIIAGGTFWQNSDKTQTAHAIRGSGNWVSNLSTTELFVNMKYSYQTKKLKLERSCQITHDVKSGDWGMSDGNGIAEIYGIGKF